MVGHQSVSAFLFAVGLIPLMILIAGPSVLIEKVLAIATLMITLCSFGWLEYIISYNRLSPLINRINPERELVWIRITKNKVLSFQVVKKGVYGQTKGVMHNKKADAVDKGDFPIRCINGNSAIIVYDMMSHNANLDQAVAWKEMFKKYKVSSGEEAYQKSQRSGKNIEKLHKKVDKINKQINKLKPQENQ